MADVELRIEGRNDSRQATSQAADGIRSLGTEAEKANPKLDRVGAAQERLRRISGDGGRAFGDYGTGLAGVGDRADEVDTRMMGLSDGIQGVTDLMGGNGKLAPHEMAMAFSDLGSAAYNTVIPSLQSVSKAGSNLIGQLGGVKTAALATGAAVGAAGLVFALKQYNDAADKARQADLAKTFEETGEAAEVMAKAAAGDVFALGDMAGAFDILLEKSPVLAQAFLDQAEAAGLNEEAVASAQKAIDEVADSEDRLALSMQNTNDAIRARTDPVFAMIDANQGLVEANRAVAEAEDAVTAAIKEHGEGSAEHQEAVAALTEARLNEAKSAYDQEAAVRDLAAAQLESGASVDEVISHLQSLADQGRISQGSVDAVSRSLRNVPDQVDAEIHAHDFATRVIQAAGDQARALDGSISNIYLQASWIGGGSAYAAFTGRTRAAGGPAGAAAGGARGGPHVVGENGPEIVDLAPGSMVHPAANTRHMLDDMWSGGVYVTLNVQGSIVTDRDIVRIIRDEFQRGGFAGLVGAGR